MWKGFLVGLVGAACLALAPTAVADVVTNASDDLRTGWYPDEGTLTPQLLSGGTFGQLWSAPVDGQVYAQPLLSSPGNLVVATETDKVYGLDPATGTQQWMTNLAPNGPWNPADLGCADITPSIGTTATPVIDTSTNTVYLTHKTYDTAHNAVWFMDALDVTTGQERSGFPVQLSGNADNAPSVSFDAQDQQQRPGLLLLNGVVYAAFGSHCDTTPFQGWIFGVSAAGRITARWVDNASGDGAGIWQSGVGLASDGPGTILFATGNGGAPSTPTPGNSPPATCGECVMRLDVQPDGSLKAVDFFAPYDAGQLDVYDGDFGSGGVVGLPDAYFGTSGLPHLAVAVGKEGYVYLLNRDSLGGFEQGAGGADAVIGQPVGPYGGVWGRPAVWPGDGGYVYIPTSSGQSGGGELDVYQYGLTGSGLPSLARVANSSDAFGFGSGSPVITSDGTTSGSALVWIIWAADRTGGGAQLRAYDPVPVKGQPVLRWSAPIGTATNYSTPGVGGGRLYVGTRDGHVLGFGSPVTQPLSASALSFPATTDGTSSAPQTLTMTANRPLTISRLSLGGRPSQFSWANPSQPLPVTLRTGQQFSVQVTFTPTGTGSIGDQLTATTDAGDVSFSLSGTGQAPLGKLQAAPSALSLGGTAVGGHLSGTVTFSNVGGQPLTVKDVQSPGAPFSATGAPAPNDTIQPGGSVAVQIAFDPTAVGQYRDKITLDTTNGQSVSIGLSGSASTPGLLQFSSQAVDFGAVPVGSTATRMFTISNVGGTDVTIDKSKPPFGGAFAATSTLPEGTTLAAGQTVTETVTFTPTSADAASGTWEITGDDGSGVHAVQFTGTGITPGTGTSTDTTTTGTTTATTTAGSAASAASAPSAGAAASPPANANPSVAIPRSPKAVPASVSRGRLSSLHITYTAKAPGISRFVLERAASGRRGAHGCVAATAHNRALPGCTRFVTVKSFFHRAPAGAVRLHLIAFVPARRLPPGTYRLRASLLDSAGQTHTLVTAFRITAGAKPSRRGGPLARVARGSGTPLATDLADLLRRLVLLF